MAKSFVGLAEDHRVRGIIVSWEPFDKSTAQVLLEHYQNITKIRELMVLGNILFLEKDIKQIQKPVGDISEETVFQSIGSTIKNCWNFHHAEYCYIFCEGRWISFTCNPEKTIDPIQRVADIPNPPSSISDF